MRLMIVGSLNGQISTAGKIAISRGAKVTHAEDAEQALGALRSGRGADLIMIDVKQDIAGFIAQLKEERFVVPVVACGINTDAATAVRAIKAGAKEYIPLPPNAELIAAVLQAVTEESNAMIAGDASMKAILAVADRVAPSEATILITGESGTGKEVMSRYIFTRRASATTARSFPSPAPPFPKACWNPNCSATKKAPSPARSHAARVNSRKPMAARCCSTR